MRPIRLARRDLWTLAALAAASLAILLSAPAQYLGRQEDDLLYLLSSQALARGTYRLLISPGLPPLTMIHPGFPLVLLPVTLLSGDNFGVHQVFCALILAAVPWVLWKWLRRRLDRGESLLICLLWATSPLVLSQAGTVMSEGAYLLFALALLFVLESPGRGVAAGILTLAVTQLRPAGVSMIPAVLVRPIRNRRWSQALWSAAIPGAALILWVLWSYCVSGGSQKVQELELFYRNQGWAYPLKVTFANARFYLSSWGASYLPLSLGAGPAGWLLGAALSALSVLGCLRALRSDACDPAVWMLAGAAGMHAFWPWHYERYLPPLLPWLLWTAARGLGRWSLPVLGVMLAGQILFQTPQWLGGNTPWSKVELAETYSWLGSRSNPADIIASAAYVRDGYYCARPSLPLPSSPDAPSFAELLKKGRVRLVLWQDALDIGLSVPESSPVRRELDDVRRFLTDKQRFRLVYENPRENSRVYALR